MFLLEIKSISKRFGGLQAINDLSINVDSGVIKSVIGPNGAGKTTLFNLISGLLRPDAGEIYFNQEKISHLKPHRIAGKKIIRTFQNLKLSTHLSVLENVMLGRHTCSSCGFISGMLNSPGAWKEERKIRESSLEYIRLLSLEDQVNTKVGNLPFGKQRAVELARALAAEPELILLDEPASGLNIYETREVSRIILKIRELGTTVLLVEHDMSLVMDISDEIVVINFGRKIAEGIPQVIQREPEVINIYLGEDDA